MEKEGFPLRGPDTVQYSNDSVWKLRELSFNSRSTSSTVILTTNSLSGGEGKYMHTVTMQTFSIGGEHDKNAARVPANQEGWTPKEELVKQGEQRRIDAGARPAIGNSRLARMGIPW